MGYAEKEQSLISGEPVELYSFNKGDQFWTYTCGSIPITYGGRLYEPVLIHRGNIEQCANSLKTLVKIEVDRTNKFAINFILAPIEGVIQLTIYRGHGINPANYVAYWKGFVFSVKFKPKIIVIVASPKTSSLKRTGLMRRYQRSCSHPIYSTRCTLEKPNYKISGTIISVDGTEIIADEFGTTPGSYEDWLAGGIFELADGSNSQMIVLHNKTEKKIIIAHRIRNLEVSDEFYVYAGCNHSGQICKEKFSNKLNYGGQEFIPNKNPFVGDGISS